MTLPTEAELKKLVYEMSRAEGMKVGHCYEKIAKNLGFRTYAAMRVAMKAPDDHRHQK